MPDRKELSRKIVHIGTGPVVPLAWWLQLPAWVAVPAALVVTLVTAINHRWRLLAAVEDADRDSYGTVAYGLAITVLLLLYWPDQAIAVCAGVLVMAFADGDQLTNMLQPFWALPLLGITGLEARALLPYTVRFFAVGLVGLALALAL